MTASRFVQPIDYYGQYKTGSWAGYTFKEPLGYTSGVHTGVDYNGPGAGNADLGLPIRAIANGIVRAVEDKSGIGFGKTIIIEHPLSASLKSKLGCDSLFSRSMHCQTIIVGVGQEVKAGQTIASVGNSGTQWAHLHLDLYKNTISYGGVHYNYDKDTQLASYLDAFEFIQQNLNNPDEDVLQPFQRVVGPNGVNHREAPNTGAKIRQEWLPGEVLDFAGYVTGENVNNNPYWYVGKYSGGYLWSGAFENSTLNGLAALDLPPTPEPEKPTPVPPPEPPAMFIPDSPLVTKVVPSPNYGAVNNDGTVDKNASQIPQFIVLHQWGNPALNYKLDGVLNHLADAGSETGVQYVADDTGIYQMVKETKRAWHAGPEGNNGIGIEINPNGGDVMWALVRALIKDINSRYAREFPIRKHSDFMATECPKYLDLSKLSEASGDLEPRVKALEDKLSKMKEVL